MEGYFCSQENTASVFMSTKANNSNPKNCPFHTFLFEEPCLLPQCILFYSHRGYEL